MILDYDPDPDTEYDDGTGPFTAEDEDAPGRATFGEYWDDASEMECDTGEWPCFCGNCP